jgi:hypothetical protein
VKFRPAPLLSVGGKGKDSGRVCVPTGFGPPNRAAVSKGPRSKPRTQNAMKGGQLSYWPVELFLRSLDRGDQSITLLGRGVSLGLTATCLEGNRLSLEGGTRIVISWWCVSAVVPKGRTIPRRALLHWIGWTPSNPLNGRPVGMVVRYLSSTVGKYRTLRRVRWAFCPSRQGRE